MFFLLKVDLDHISPQIKYEKFHSIEHFADGYSNVDRARTVPTAAGLRAGGTVIYAVGVGEGGGLDRAEIHGLASDPDHLHGFFMPNRTNINVITNSILDTMCGT